MATQVRTREETFERIKGALIEEGFPEEDVRMEAFFWEDLGADSLDLVELVLELEDQFGVKIPDKDAKTLKTVGQAVDYILKRQEGG